jgi:undecaprenyl-diphosphatase
MKGGKILRSLTQPAPVVLVAALLIVAGALAFAKVADDIADQDMDKFDYKVLRGLRQADNPTVPIGGQWVGQAARDISGLGGPAVLALATLAVAGFLLLAGKRRQMWLVLLAPASGVALGYALKSFFARPRPEIVPHLDLATTMSFPSGHSMMSGIVYLTLGALLAGMVTRWRLKLYILLAAATVTVLVGVSRVVLGVHYPTDVLGGWAAGLVWALLWWLAARWIEKRRPGKPGRNGAKDAHR